MYLNYKHIRIFNISEFLNSDISKISEILTQLKFQCVKLQGEILTFIIFWSSSILEFPMEIASYLNF